MWDFLVKSTTLRPSIPHKNTLPEKGYLHLHMTKQVQKKRVSVFETSHHGENPEKSENPTMVGYCI
jgi:hypothetical protein